MNSQERKIKLADIQSHAAEAEKALKLPYQGETRTFDVYKIPLEFLVFNKENGRIASLVKSYTREHQAINVETKEGANLIAKFLYNAHIENYKRKYYQQWAITVWYSYCRWSYCRWE